MKNRVRWFWTAVLSFSAGLWMTGCVCPQKNVANVCKVNEDRGLAAISCQPVDVEAAQGDTVVFAVDAKGKDLVYQWYFRGESGVAGVVGTGTIGGRAAQLTVQDVASAKAGAYWCEIDSTGVWGAPVRTRTRDAQLGIKSEVGGTGSGGIQVYPPQLASMPPGNSGSDSCGTHCGWINYQNGGAAFDPDPATTKGLAKVRIGTVYRDNTTFNLKWFDNLGHSGCAVNTSGSTTQKEFTSDPSRLYVFTAYFVSSCPAPGAQVYFELSFVP